MFDTINPQEVSFLGCGLLLWDQPGKLSSKIYRYLAAKKYWCLSLLIMTVSIGFFLIHKVPVLISVLIIAGTVRKIFVSRQFQQHMYRHIGLVNQDVGIVIGQLKAGLSLTLALKTIAENSAHSHVTIVWRQLSTWLHLGGRPEHSELFEVITQCLDTKLLAHRTVFFVWESFSISLSSSLLYGYPLIEVLSYLQNDIGRRQQFVGEVLSKAAGIRLSAIILAGLPVCGVLLGELMHLSPLYFLTHHPIGTIVLILGVGLNCLGLWWSEAIISKALQ